MSEPYKPPSWYRHQAAETRAIADLVDGVDKSDLLQLAARWDDLARIVVEAEYDPGPHRATNVIQLAAWRKRRKR